MLCKPLMAPEIGHLTSRRGATSWPDLISVFRRTHHFATRRARLILWLTQCVLECSPLDDATQWRQKMSLHLKDDCTSIYAEVDVRAWPLVPGLLGECLNRTAICEQIRLQLCSRGARLICSMVSHLTSQPDIRLFFGQWRETARLGSGQDRSTASSC